MLAPCTVYMKITLFAEHILNKKKKYVFDGLLVFLCLFIGILSFVIAESLKEDGAYVTVKIGGDTVAEYPLDVNREYSLNGGTNLLVIKDGYAFMVEADCPDHLCVSQGKISRTGERITCLPNKIMIDVVGAGEEILEN